MFFSLKQFVLARALVIRAHWCDTPHEGDVAGTRVTTVGEVGTVTTQQTLGFGTDFAMYGVSRARLTRLGGLICEDRQRQIKAEKRRDNERREC